MKRTHFAPFLALLVGACLSLSIPSANSQEVKLAISDALAAGDTVLAISLLEKEIGIDKAYHMNYYMLGRIYFERGQYVEAKEQFRTAQEKKSKHYESLYYLGLTHLNLNELADAKQVMEKGRKKDRKHTDWFDDGYGLVMMAQENYPEADRAFRRAISEDSSVADYHIHLGDANFYQGIPSLAVAEYEIALQMDTASTEVYFHYAQACLEMKDYACAMEKLRVVLTKDSTYAPAWMRAGSIYFKAALSSRSRSERTNRFKDVIGAYRKYFELASVTADSSTVRPYFELAMAYVNVNGFEEATKLFEDVLAIPYEPRDIYFYYGKSLWGTRDYVKSGDMLARHLEWVEAQEGDNPSRVNDVELYQLLGDSYYYRKPNDFASAIKYYTKSIALEPQQKRLLQNIAVAYHSMKSYRQAIEFYSRRIELGIDSTSASIYRNAGYCALNIANNEGGGDDMDLEEEEEDVEAAPAEDADVNYYQVAADFMEKYLEYASNDARVLMMMGNTYLFQLADCANGVKYFEQLLAVEPTNCDAKKALGYAYFGGVCTKSYTRALRYLSDAYSCVTNAGDACSDGDLILWIAQCYHLRAADKDKAEAKDDFRNANEWYHKGKKCDPANTAFDEGIKQTQFEF